MHAVIYDMKSRFILLFIYRIVIFYFLFFFNFLKPSSMQKEVIFIHSLRMSGFHA